MAKFREGNLDLKNNQKVRLGDSQNAELYWDGSEAIFTSTISGVDPTQSYHISTKGYTDTISGTLQTDINGKSDTGHSHTESDVTDLDKYTQAEVDTISGSLSSEIDSDISTHSSDTTSIHGITDTSDLALKSGNVNQLNDITSTGANIEDAVTKKHAESHTITSHSDITDATGAQIEELTGGGDTTLHDHDGISENIAARHAESHTIISHSDITDATGAQIEELTGGTDTTLHSHLLLGLHNGRLPSITLSTVISTVDAVTSVYSVDVSAVSNTVVHAVYACNDGGNKVLFNKSLNGGNSWGTPVEVVSVATVWARISSVDANNIHVIYIDDATDNLLHKSSVNGGANWSAAHTIATLNGNDLADISAYSASTAFITYDDATDGVSCAVTTNAGVDWTKTDIVAATAAAHAFRIECVDDQTAYAVWAATNIQFTKTVNGGTSWNTAAHVDDTGSCVCMDMSVVDANTVVVVQGESGGNYVFIYHTINGGSNWTPRSVVDGNFTTIPNKISCCALTADNIFVYYTPLVDGNRILRCAQCTQFDEVYTAWVLDSQIGTDTALGTDDIASDFYNIDHIWNLYTNGDTDIKCTWVNLGKDVGLGLERLIDGTTEVDIVDIVMDADLVTFSGTIDHDTIINTHNMTTDIVGAIEAAGFTLDSTKIIDSADENLLFKFGRAFVGHMGTNDMATFGHRDRCSSTEYAVAHAASGKTNINTAAGQNLDFRIGGALKASLGATGLTLYNINSEATDVDKFLVSNAGLIKYRAGWQVLSDIGADNYGSWSFAVDGVTKDAITSGDTFDIVGGDNITVTRTTEDQITIVGAAGGGSKAFSFFIGG